MLNRLTHSRNQQSGFELLKSIRIQTTETYLTSVCFYDQSRLTICFSCKQTFVLVVKCLIVSEIGCWEIEVLQVELSTYNYYFVCCDACSPTLIIIRISGTKIRKLKRSNVKNRNCFDHVIDSLFSCRKNLDQDVF